jgi:hypothetical protein
MIPVSFPSLNPKDISLLLNNPNNTHNKIDVPLEN